MLDARARALYRPGLDPLAERLHGIGFSASVVTGAGLAVGVAACVAVALEHWLLALVLWLVNRTLD